MSGQVDQSRTFWVWAILLLVWIGAGLILFFFSPSSKNIRTIRVGDQTCVVRFHETDRRYHSWGGSYPVGYDEVVCPVSSASR